MWQHDTVTKYDPITGDGGLFAQYMNTFMKIKMEASLNTYEGLLCDQMIFHSMQDVVQWLIIASKENISGEILPYPQMEL